MDFAPIAKTILACANHAYEIGKATITWCGHTIKEGYSLYVIPASEKISAIALISFNQLEKMMLLGPEKIFSIAGGLLLASIIAFKIADRKAYEEDMIAKTAWKTLGVASFISSTALISVGMFTILSI